MSKADRLIAELVSAMRFSVVGGIATAIHIIILWLLLSRTALPVFLANTIAFIGAFGFSFMGNYLWTFGSRVSPACAMRRFLAVSTIAFLLNSVVLAVMLSLGVLGGIYAAMISATVIPIVTFLASRFWVFAYQRDTNLNTPSTSSPVNFVDLQNALRKDWVAAGIFSAVAGLFAFLMIVDLRVLDPSYIAWLGQGDPSTHYLGWLFFRNSDWSFPFGLNPEYGLELSNSILFSDSNPLLAIFFKVFAAALPDTFQYFGIWLLTCFILQSWFAVKLMGLATKDPLVIAVASLFFALAPPMIWRLYGHFSLMGHFLILAALYMTLQESPKPRVGAWSALLAAAALVHAYLLAMVGFIWGVDSVERLIKRAVRFVNLAVEWIVVLAATVLACWQAGYFSVGSDISSDGYGLYRMNLLSVVDSSGWSYLLGDIPEGSGDYEGFNYLGLGIIFLAMWALPNGLAQRSGRLSDIAKKRPVLFASAAVLTVFALSNNVGLASLNFDVPLPASVLQVANTFRASGRLFWPVFYLLYFIILFTVIRRHSRRVVVAVLGFALFIQIADTSKGWRDIRERLAVAGGATWHTSMVSPFWREAANKYRNVRWVPPTNHSKSWRSVAYYAGTHGLATDAVYLARVRNANLEMAQRKAKAVLATGRFEPDSLYILDELLLRQVAISVNSENDLFAHIDGFFIVAPEWKKCALCYKVEEEIDTSELMPPAVGIADRLLFGQSQAGLKYLGAGWSHPEEWGTWSDGDEATIILPLKEPKVTAIVVKALPLLGPSRPQQVVKITVNGYEAGEAILSAGSERQFRVIVPEAAKRKLGPNPILKLRFDLPNSARPVDMGINNDRRSLAIGLVSISVK